MGWATVSDGSGDGDGGDSGGGDAGPAPLPFSMTAGPRSLRRPRVASARRNRICTQAARPRARGCGAPRAGHAPLCASAPAPPEHRGRGSSGPASPPPHSTPQGSIRARTRPTELPVARPRPPVTYAALGPGAPRGPRQRLSGPGAAGCSPSCGCRGPRGGWGGWGGGGAGTRGRQRGNVGEGPAASATRRSGSNPSPPPRLPPSGVQTSPRDQGTAPPGAGWEEEEGKEKGGECACLCAPPQS